MRGSPRQILCIAAALAAAGILGACGEGAPSADSARAGQVGGSVRGLPGLKTQANQLLDGGSDAFKQRLASLRGHPVVVNQWASWCGPCRFEFPFFRRQAEKYEGQVAFLGVNSQDNRDNAAAFLKQLPVPYPHYFDSDGNVARLFRGGRAFPTTAFYDAAGKLVYTHIGGYASEAKLEEEVRRYALDG